MAYIAQDQRLPPHIIVPIPIIPPMLPPMNVPIIHNEYHPTIPSPAIIDDNTNKSIANIFCFGAFVDRQSGVVYNNLTGNFPFMSYNGSVASLWVTTTILMQSLLCQSVS
jgi:hypothetical protein